MGSLEKEVYLERKRGMIKRTILGCVASAGILAVAALAPNALQVLDQIQGKKRKSLWQRTSIDTARCRMVDKGLLKYNNRGYLELTDSGQRELELLGARNYKLKIPKRWDRKWRLIIFDIQEKRKVMRNKVRRTLMSVGFVQLQKSVWVYPYDCEDFITLIKVDFKIGKDILYLIVDKIEYDVNLKKVFGLK